MKKAQITVFIIIGIIILGVILGVVYLSKNTTTESLNTEEAGSAQIKNE